MSILISFTDRGKCIYDENGSLCIEGLTVHKVLRKCDRCGELRWVLFHNIFNRKKKGKKEDYCPKCNLIKITKEFGVDNVSQLDWVKKKKEETTQLHYGTKYFFQTEEFKENLIKIINEKYGVKNVSQSEKIKEKKKETCRKNFGVDYPMQSDVIMEKSRKTNVETYGFPCSFQSPEVRKTWRENFIKEHGVDHPMKIEEIVSMFRGENSPRWKPERHEDEGKAYIIFYEAVRLISNQNFHDHYYEINPNNLKRGDDYHLDHIISVCDCWDAGIRDPRIPAHPKNLQMLTKKENLSKNSNSHMPLSLLLDHCANSGMDISLSGCSIYETDINNGDK